MCYKHISVGFDIAKPGQSECTYYKGPVKLIKRVKTAHSFLQSVSEQFHVIILSLPILFYKWLSKILRNRLLKMEIWAILIFGVIFEQP